LTDGTRCERRAVPVLDHLSIIKDEETVMSGSISPFPMVRKGSRDHPVRTLQHLLRARNHPVAVDGIFGPKTDAAVRAFQMDAHLAVDGIVGRHTWSALIVTVKRGSQGDAVRGVQEEFQFRNLSGDPSKGPQIDGIFGPVTEAAVRGFQQALAADIPSVAVDGIVGPVTWQALVSGMLSF
jgi:peptidoglycan hydrolase-like protein with peptidoglycan-binding domain